MPKPKNKEELLHASQENFERLFALIDSLSKDQQQQSFGKDSLNQNIRDVLWHLHEWHSMQMKWYQIGMKGKKPDMPAKGYSWKETPLLNKKIWEDCQAISLEESKKELKQSFDEIQAIIHRHNNQELFEKKRYAWTGSTSLGAYLIANTSSHYDWAYRFIKKSIR